MGILASGSLPHSLHPGWLGQPTADALLAHAVRNEASFQPSLIRRNSERVFAPTVRRSLTLTDLGPFTDTIAGRARQLAPQLKTQFGLAAWKPSSMWLELIVHGDGDFVRPHIDVVMGDAVREKRQVTLVYYLRREPPRFRGGELRLFGFGQNSFVDIEPRHDLLLAFPSIALHAVNPVSCPAAEFSERRFSVNICFEG